jgi:hypothetical protein
MDAPAGTTQAHRLNHYCHMLRTKLQSFGSMPMLCSSDAAAISAMISTLPAKASHRRVTARWGPAFLRDRTATAPLPFRSCDFRPNPKCRRFCPEG